jgi:hypothetical protein
MNSYNQTPCQPVSYLPGQAPHHFLQAKERFMGLILLEALGALVLLILIVWWTMFSGRKKGEINADDDKQP